MNAVVLALLLQAAPPVPLTVVVVGDGQRADGLAATVGLRVRGALQNDGRFAVGGFTDNLEPGDVEDAEGTLEIARSRIDEADQAFTALEGARATKLMREASEALALGADVLGSNAEAVTALAKLGTMYNQLGKEQKARAAFRRVLLLEPGFQASDAGLGPDDVNLLQEVEEELAFEERGAVSVTSNGPGAEVFVDGKFHGTTPMKLEDLAPGVHVYAVRRDGYRRRAARFRVAPGKTKKVKLRMRALPGFGAAKAAAFALDVKAPEIGEGHKVLADAVRASDEILLIRIGNPGVKTAFPIDAIRYTMTHDVILGAVTTGSRPESENLDPTLDSILEKVLAAPSPATIEKVEAPVVVEEESEEVGLLWPILGGSAAAGAVVTLVAVGATAVAAIVLAPQYGIGGGNSEGGAPPEEEDPRVDQHRRAERWTVQGY